MELKTTQPYKRITEFKINEDIKVNGLVEALKILNELEPGAVFVLKTNDYRHIVMLKIRDEQIGNYRIVYFGKGFDIIKLGVLELHLKKAVAIQIRQDIVGVMNSYANCVFYQSPKIQN